MRTNVYWALLIVVVAVFESTWLGAIRLQGVLPDLVLLLVVYFAVTHGEERAMFTGFLGGIFQDVAADTGLGHHVLCLVVTGFVVGRVSRRLVVDHPAVKAGLVLGASMVHGLLYTSVDYVQNPDLNAMYSLAVTVVPRAFYTSLVTPLVFFALDRSKQLGEPLHGRAG